MSESIDLPDILIERIEDVALVELFRPPHNFIDAGLLGRLAASFEELDRDPGVRVIVLAARGKSFCAGADFGQPGAGSGKAKSFYAEAVRLFKTGKPIIAAVQGPCIGAGLGLALVADFRIAAREARFAANFVKIGIHPGFGVTHTLPRIVGEQAAAMLLYTGRRIDGEEAQRIGLADMVCEGNVIRERALELASEVASNAPLAVVATRATLRKGLAEQVAIQTDHELAEQTRLFGTADFLEGVRAVSERRPGNFIGG